MPRLRALNIALALCLFTVAQLLPPSSIGRSHQASRVPPTATSPTQAQAQDNYGKLPVSFELNSGQTNAAVRFLAHGAGYTLALTPSEALLALARQSSARPAALPAAPPLPNPATQPMPTTTALVGMRWMNAAPATTITGEDQLPGTVNYFIGNDPKQWHTNIPTYARVRYHNVYPGIDLVYYGAAGQLEYNFEVAPGADPTDILLAFSGATRLGVDLAGNLSLQLPGGFIQQDHPLIYQQINGARQSIAGGYQLLGADRVAFRLARYDASRPLIIDPVYRYSTYLGGSEDDALVGIALDAVGDAYVTGWTQSDNFPVANALQATYNGGYPNSSTGSDIFITKLNAAGTNFIFSTYLGGATGPSYSPDNTSNMAAGIAVDGAGNAYITGSTDAADYPVVNPIQTHLAGGSGNVDAIVTKINPSGSALVYSTFLGGSFEDYGSAIAVDAAGNAYVTGTTYSYLDFPLKNAVQKTFGGNADAFVTEINATGSAYVFSTYLGGANTDDGSAIAVDNAGNIYITGDTSEGQSITDDNFPTTPGAYQTTFGGLEDAFVTKFAPGGTSLIYSTYLGGLYIDYGSGITVDSVGDAYVTGVADGSVGSNFPYTYTLPGVTAGGRNAFITSFNPTGTALRFSTFLGGASTSGGFTGGDAIAVDETDDIYVTGWTGVAGFPMAYPLQGAFANNNNPFSYSDAFVSELNPSATAILYSSYLGGNVNDVGMGIVVGTGGNVYVAGQTSSFALFPISNALQPTFGGRFINNGDAWGDGFITKFLILPTPVMTAGIYRPSVGTFYLRNTNATGAPDVAVTFGASLDVPVAGDWTGKGYKSIGVFRNGTWYLRNSNTTGAPDIAFQFGSTGDIPLVGDWTGKGYDSIGVFRPSNATFYLRNSNTTGPADITVRYGASTDLPVVGDWTSKGYDSVGVFRNGIFYLRNSNTTGLADLTVYFGASGDTPIAGDWTGKGYDSIGVFRAGVFLLRNTNTGGGPDLNFAYGSPTDTPIAGQWLARTYGGAAHR